MNLKSIAKQNNWEIKKLDKITFFQEGPGVRKHQYTTNGVKILNVANLFEGQLDLSRSDRFISEEEAYGKYSHFLVDENDLIIACSGIQVDYFHKKMGFVKKEHLPLCMNTSTMRFKVLDENMLDIQYLAYFLKTDLFKKQIQRLITGSAQLNFGPSHIKKVDILIPPLETQKKIVKILDKAHFLIDARQKQITALSKLKQSIFYDMFGDPEDYSNNSKRLKIEDLFRVQTGSTPSRKENKYWENGNIPWIKTTQLQNDLILTADEYVTEQAVNERNLKLFPENTILIAMYGQGKTRGRTGLLRFPATTNQACAALIPKKEINLSFIWMQLILRYEALRDLGRGGNQPNLNLSLIRGFDVLFPDENKQKKYSEITSEIDTTLNLVKHSLEEMDTLYNSLMQQAFKGERF